jgi:hypothetical protein
MGRLTKKTAKSFYAGGSPMVEPNIVGRTINRIQGRARKAGSVQVFKRTKSRVSGDAYNVTRGFKLLKGGPTASQIATRAFGRTRAARARRKRGV